MVKIVVAIMSVPLFYAAMENENVLNLYAKIPKHVSTSKGKTVLPKREWPVSTKVDQWLRLSSVLPRELWPKDESAENKVAQDKKLGLDYVR